MSNETEKLKGYRFPKVIIRYGVWLYHRFLLSLLDVEEILLERGIQVSYETVREWGLKFGPQFAQEIKCRSPRRGDKWHLDEVCIVIKKQKYWLWRAVDPEGYELDILLQSRRNQKAAKRFFRKLLKGLRYTPRVMITDKLKSYGAAKKQMRRFKSPKHVQRFLSVHGPVYNLFRSWRYKNKASDQRQHLQTAFQTWEDLQFQVTCA